MTRIVALFTLAFSLPALAEPAATEPAPEPAPDDAVVTAPAEPVELEVYPFNFHVVPGLSLSGADGSRVEQHFALDLIAGKAAVLDGLELATVFAWESERASGVQLSGAFGVVEGPLSGVQAASGVTVAGPVAGAQLAGGVTIAEDVSGLQTSGGVALSRGLHGLQMASVSVALGDVVGAQLGGVSVATESLTGLQVAAVNVTTGDLTGLQAGTVNVTAGRVHGVQLGLVNYAEDVDAPIGLLSIVKNGQVHMDAWASDAVPTALALRIGSRYVYNLFAIGANPLGDETKWMLGLGIGGHIPVWGETVFVDVDLLTWHVNEGDQWTTGLNLLSQVRLTAGWRPAERFALFGGVSANVLTSQVDDGADWRVIDGWSWHHDDLDVSVWPGFLLGVRI